MRVLGVDLSRESPQAPVESTLVLLGEDGRVVRAERLPSIAELAAAVVQLAAGEPFLLGVNVPVVVPEKPARVRPIESLLRRRLAFKLPPGGRAAAAAAEGAAGAGLAGERLMTALAAAGQPSLPYPDRDRRRSGVMETDAALALKVLLWQGSPLAATHDPARGEELLRAYAPPAYRAEARGAKASWADCATALDLALRALGPLDDFDVQPARDALDHAASRAEVEHAGALLDAALIAGTAWRYLEAPQGCVFAGERETGYVVLPADALVRRIVLGETRAPAARLFPHGSLRERLGPHTQLRAVDLLQVPGRPQRVEASFPAPPTYEFDNLDEMLWWKHCRHVEGTRLPTEGLRELVVSLADGASNGDPLKLVRSRHATLSFRFEPPAAWRARVPTRDGRTYPFQVLRAIYETAGEENRS